ncbi:MAG TPA: nickel pincer cofactor biosynthesis protein LarB [Vicinamibacteria bacterium]|nr:nickel pincer cofactor biosynthesis protein LarB [Vicinamibacteria bacterium]
MSPERVRDILRAVERGEQSADTAWETLRTLGFEDLGFAKVDHHRALRRGFPEVVFGPGKTPLQIASIVRSLADGGHLVLVTKTNQEAFRAVEKLVEGASWKGEARAIVVGEPPATTNGKAAVLAAGTSDIAVAEEAALTLELMGASVERIIDVGVAGLHRLAAHRSALLSSDVLVVVAGMEGALPSVVSGLTDVPVIAVPTSVGYGASFFGLAALLAMLNGCSPGVAVVNIDNGFGAGYLAGMICRKRAG